MSAIEAIRYAIENPEECVNGQVWVRSGTEEPTAETPALLTLSPMPEGDLPSCWHLFCPADLAIEAIGWF